MSDEKDYTITNVILATMIVLFVAGLGTCVVMTATGHIGPKCVDRLPDPGCFHDDHRLVVEDEVAICRCEVGP